MFAVAAERLENEIDGACVRSRQPPGVAYGENGAALNYSRRIICRFLALLALVCVDGCTASGPEPTFETAYSAVGLQVK